MTDSKTTHVGLDVAGILGVAFVVLKLTGTINWSWWWVTLPFWGGAAMVALILVIMLLAALVARSWDRT